jgi:hypothetical protein
MFNVKTLLRQAVLAVALAGSSLVAIAVPVSFHVDLNTTTLAGNGYFDLQFGALASVPGTTVTFSNFTGAVGPAAYFDGSVVFNADGSFTLANFPDMGGLLGFSALFGGRLGFDLAFSDDYSTETGTDGSTLSVALLDADYAPIGDPYGIAVFELIPGIGVQTSVVGNYAQISPVATAVPEPADWLLMATGLALLGLTRPSCVRSARCPARPAEGTHQSRSMRLVRFFREV